MIAFVNIQATVGRVAGEVYIENEWGFGQIVTVTAWLPVFGQFFNAWKYKSSIPGSPAKSAFYEHLPTSLPPSSCSTLGPTAPIMEIQTKHTLVRAIIRPRLHIRCLGPYSRRHDVFHDVQVIGNKIQPGSVDLHFGRRLLGTFGLDLLRLIVLVPPRLSHKQDLEARLPPMHVELLLQAGTRVTKHILWRFDLGRMRASGILPRTEKPRF